MNERNVDLKKSILIKAFTNKENQTYEIIEKLTKKSSKTSSEDKLLKTIRLPQTILLDADSRIYFSCCFRRGEKLENYRRQLLLRFFSYYLFHQRRCRGFL